MENDRHFREVIHLYLHISHKFVSHILHHQYTTYIKQDAIITKLGDIWLHVSAAVTGHH